jgi:hypothetical protein
LWRGRAPLGVEELALDRAVVVAFLLLGSFVVVLLDSAPTEFKIRVLGQARRLYQGLTA